MTTATITSAVEIQEALRLLYVERALARDRGLHLQREYMAELERDIVTHRHAYTGAALTEIATFRGQLSGQLVG
ncbi:MAG TPA: hypothetical protein VF526_13580 [Solirubrobacteraceae bacterium]|jgi:hypothetical protein